jgi:opacity protein-like surface antigen
MRSILFALTAAVLLMASGSLAQTDPETEAEPQETKDPYRDRLGFRAGYVGTPSSISDAFGGGLDLSLHWVHRFKYPFAIDATLGGSYMGSTGREDITISIFGQRFDNVAMRLLHITVAPMMEFALGERTHFFLSAGGGMYRVSVLVDQAFSEADLSNSHFGVVAGGGIIRRISGNWFLDASVRANKFWTSTDIDDWFFRYSQGDGNPVFYNVSLGLMLRLF